MVDELHTVYTSVKTFNGRLAKYITNYGYKTFDSLRIPYISLPNIRMSLSGHYKVPVDDIYIHHGDEQIR